MGRGVAVAVVLLGVLLIVAGLVMVWLGVPAALIACGVLIAAYGLVAVDVERRPR